jgi:hypothetical protein
MFRLFNLFGQSAALNALDDALRASGVHPLLVPDAVKLTVLRLNKEDQGAGTGDAVRSDSAQLLAYCMLGRDPFIESVGVAAADRAEDRLEAALDAGGSLDAKIILLSLHSGLIAPEIAERIDVEGE